ncbi:MAG: hypothetical protein E6Q97_12965 [Desulfurellales bacterium]|nr:MAG: hypothetical protein E6Q97_12965 [Desulfurellales bacterium]
MTDVQEAKRPKAKREASALDALMDAADLLSDAIASLPPADVQRLNIELNGNHEITVADAARMASAVSSSSSKVKKIV